MPSPKEIDEYLAENLHNIEDINESDLKTRALSRVFDKARHYFLDFCQGCETFSRWLDFPYTAEFKKLYEEARSNREQLFQKIPKLEELYNIPDFQEAAKGGRGVGTYQYKRVIKIRDEAIKAIERIKSNPEDINFLKDILEIKYEKPAAPIPSQKEIKALSDDIKSLDKEQLTAFLNILKATADQAPKKLNMEDFLKRADNFIPNKEQLTQHLIKKKYFKGEVLGLIEPTLKNYDFRISIGDIYKNIKTFKDSEGDIFYCVLFVDQDGAVLTAFTSRQDSYLTNEIRRAIEVERGLKLSPEASTSQTTAPKVEDADALTAVKEVEELPEIAILPKYVDYEDFLRNKPKPEEKYKFLESFKKDASPLPEWFDPVSFYGEVEEANRRKLQLFKKLWDRNHPVKGLILEPTLSRGYFVIEELMKDGDGEKVINNLYTYVRTFKKGDKVYYCAIKEGQRTPTTIVGFKEDPKFIGLYLRPTSTIKSRVPNFVKRFPLPVSKEKIKNDAALKAAVTSENKIIKKELTEEAPQIVKTQEKIKKEVVTPPPAPKEEHKSEFKKVPRDSKLLTIAKSWPRWGYGYTNEYYERCRSLWREMIKFTDYDIHTGKRFDADPFPVGVRPEKLPPTFPLLKGIDFEDKITELLQTNKKFAELATPSFKENFKELQEYRAAQISKMYEELLQLSKDRPATRENKIIKKELTEEVPQIVKTQEEKWKAIVLDKFEEKYKLKSFFDLAYIDYAAFHEKVEKLKKDFFKDDEFKLNYKFMEYNPALLPGSAGLIGYEQEFEKLTQNNEKFRKFIGIPLREEFLKLQNIRREKLKFLYNDCIGDI